MESTNESGALGMIYEIYLDSILVEVFLWDFCVLKLTNAGFCRVSGGRRILLGAAAGTIGYTVPLFLPLSPLGKGIAVLAACGGMLWLTFPVKDFQNFLRVLGNYLKYALLLGGSVLIVLRLPVIREHTGKVFFSLLTLCLMTAGGLTLQRRSSAGGNKTVGKAILIWKEKKIAVDALVDSGNSLTEPISGKPVCVLDRSTARELWGDEVIRDETLSGEEFLQEELLSGEVFRGDSLSGNESFPGEGLVFRMIPYRSVGQKKGLMRGYLLPELRLELGGPVRIVRDVYMAVSPQELTKEEGKTQVLIHPALIAQDRKKNRAEKEREGHTK